MLDLGPRPCFLRAANCFESAEPWVQHRPGLSSSGPVAGIYAASTSTARELWAQNHAATCSLAAILGRVVVVEEELGMSAFT